MVNHNQLRQHGGTPLVVESRSGESESESPKTGLESDSSPSPESKYYNSGPESPNPSPSHQKTGLESDSSPESEYYNSGYCDLTVVSYNCYCWPKRKISNK